MIVIQFGQFGLFFILLQEMRQDKLIGSDHEPSSDNQTVFLTDEGNMAAARTEVSKLQSIFSYLSSWIIFFFPGDFVSILQYSNQPKTIFLSFPMSGNIPLGNFRNGKINRKINSFQMPQTTIFYLYWLEHMANFYNPS